MSRDSCASANEAPPCDHSPDCPLVGLGRVAGLVAILSVIASAGCDRLAAPEAPESFVVVRGPDGSYSTTADALEVFFSESSGQGYWCSDLEDCWEKCPDPQQDGGTTVCSCESDDDGGYWCSVTFYGPGESPGGGCGGGGGGTTDTTFIMADCRGAASLALECPPSVNRGDYTKCSVKNTGTVSYNLGSLHYAWGAGDLSMSNIGADSWGGTATSARTISVKVKSPANELLFEDSKRVDVTGRTGWKLPRLNTPATLPSTIPTGWGKRWGVHIWQAMTEPTVKPGTGPWAGEYIASGPPDIRNAIYLHPDPRPIPPATSPALIRASIPTGWGKRWGVHIWQAMTEPTVKPGTGPWAGEYIAADHQIYGTPSTFIPTSYLADQTIPGPTQPVVACLNRRGSGP